MSPLYPKLALALAITSLTGCFNGSGSSSDSNESPTPDSSENDEPSVVADSRYYALPYLQNPAPTEMTVTWFSDSDKPGTLAVNGIGEFASNPELADSLTYGASEIEYIHGDQNFSSIHSYATEGAAPAPNYKHSVRVTQLTPETSYQYSVDQPGADTFASEFKTAPMTGSREAVRFIAMSDMETEPESTQKTVRWTANALAVGGEKLGTDPDTYTRQYPVDQTEGYKANLGYAATRGPDFWVIAGDLVEKGGRQLDWDEFWRHSAGEWGTLASTTPIFPTLGNHENYWHPEAPGYNAQASMLSYDKWNTYWDLPTNYATDERYEKRYYRADYGPVTLISLDSSNGNDDDPSQDTNLMINGVESRVPDFNPGSEQWNWAIRELADAQAQGQIIFVQFHHTAFGTGVHSLPSGSAGIANGEDSQSGVPMRAYKELFERYGVTAVLSGHDELLEYVRINGVHYWDVGFAGDGLRGPGYPPTTTYVPFDQLPAEAQETHWSVHGDVPEMWNGNQLIDGGKHYGFLEVDVRPSGDYGYEVVMTPRYVFPITDGNGEPTGEFDHRQYNKVVRVVVER
ncbi:FN3 domain-containing metallophosphoesterase family protein [Marinobacter sp. 2_MG-2023]|uniref:FN3 domain-containing metallophosphoesterase family protein n=1 Tax=Marinobacter sp. 2_MG-2023 TaxID=3062679 RepID=UPI0026E3753E|nr:FN3 domain-containing metallophosphoesterase family protein [Marinobacter sp. 2_MG-2023]MDO6442236.1 FN3 domain-containing metallophosphoesterase family protein [Marinobacter sp. 2_MG-2023]